MSESLICLFLGTPGAKSELVLASLETLKYRIEGIELARLDTDSQYGELITSVSESVYRSLEKADLIIADITGSHPNVMYELGYAHALKKPVLPLVQRGTDQIPSDLRGYLYFTYELSKLEQLVDVVTDWIRRNQKRGKEA